MAPGRSCRRLAAVLLLLLVSQLGTVKGPSRAIAQVAPPAGQEAAARLASCVASSKHLLVVVLIDESGSLVKTDPSAQRVAAAEVALRGLQSLAQSSNVEIEVQLSGFSEDYRPVGEWTDLKPSSLDRLKGALGTFRSRNRGRDTDYYIALQGAQRQLAQKAAEVPGAAPCKALLWFTDGEYDIDPPKQGGYTKDYAPQIRVDSPAAAAALEVEGRQQLCGQTALVDELRRDDVPIFAVALSIPDAPIKPDDLDFLRAITNGASGSQSCGTGGSPETGVTTEAPNGSELVGIFDRVACVISGNCVILPPPPTRVCPGSDCPEGRNPFDLDGTLRRFHVLARSDADELLVLLQGPAGGPPLSVSYDRPSGSGMVGPVPVRWSWVTPQALTLDAERPTPSSGWDGTWTVTFVDPNKRSGVVARSQIALFGDLVPELVAPKELRGGKDNTLVVQAVSELDRRPPERRVDSRLEVTVSEAPGAPPIPLAATGPGPDGRFQATYRPGRDLRSAQATVTLTLLAKTGKGLALAPAVRSVTLPVIVSGYPAVSLAKARLDPVKDKGSTVAVVNITGDDRVPGCVWLEGEESQYPKSAQKPEVSVDDSFTSPEHCFSVAARATGQLRVKIDPPGTANGTLKGTLRLATRSDTEKEPLVRSLAYSAPMTRPISQAKRFGLVALFVGLGILLPILFAYALGWWSARFQPVDIVSSAAVPVAVVGSTLARAGSGPLGTEPFELRLADFDQPVQATTSRPRRVEHRGHLLRSRMSKSPVGAPRGEISRDGSFAGASRGSLRGGRAGRIRLALPGQWVASVPDRASEDEPATLLAFARLDSAPEDLRRLSAEILRELPPVVTALRKRAAEATPPDPPEGGTGPNPPGSPKDWPDDTPPPPWGS